MIAIRLKEHGPGAGEIQDAFWLRYEPGHGSDGHVFHRCVDKDGLAGLHRQALLIALTQHLRLARLHIHTQTLGRGRGQRVPIAFDADLKSSRGDHQRRSFGTYSLIAAHYALNQLHTPSSVLRQANRGFRAEFKACRVGELDDGDAVAVTGAQGIPGPERLSYLGGANLTRRRDDLDAPFRLDDMGNDLGRRRDGRQGRRRDDRRRHEPAHPADHKQHRSRKDGKTDRDPPTGRPGQGKWFARTRVN